MALTSTQIIRNYIDTIGSLERKNIQNDEQYEEIRQLKNIDIIRMNDMEDVVVAYADISITGTDRDKPQIRVFMDKIKTPYDFAKAKSMRFFAFSIFSKDKAMAKNIKNSPFISQNIARIFYVYEIKYAEILCKKER